MYDTCGLGTADHVYEREREGEKEKLSDSSQRIPELLMHLKMIFSNLKKF